MLDVFPLTSNLVLPSINVSVPTPTLPSDVMRSFSVGEPALEVENIKSDLFSTPPLSDDSILDTVCPPVPDCCAAKSIIPVTVSSDRPTPVVNILYVAVRVVVLLAMMTLPALLP